MTKEARTLHDQTLVWDSHVCLPLHPDANLAALVRHRAAGVDFVSVNVGMDMNPAQQVLATLASFRAQLRAYPDLFRPVVDTRDVERAKADGKLAVAFDLEGGLPLGGRPEAVSLFYDLGVRQIHLAYNRNNEIGGGCYDQDVPLTRLGRKIVSAVNNVGMLMDCSHTGYRTCMDIIELSTAPAFFSHANPRTLHDDRRNIYDDQIDACAASGGVVCVNGVGRFLGDPQADTKTIVRHIDYLVARIGANHVGIGLDYSYKQNVDDSPPNLDKNYWWPRAHGYTDGANVRVATPEQLPQITVGLFALGYKEADIAKILGGNMLALAKKVWRPGYNAPE